MTVSDNIYDTAYFPRQGPGVGSTININHMTDGNNGTFNTTWTGDANAGWLYDGIGLQFAGGMSEVQRFEWDMQTFGDGGWYNTLNVPLRVQVTTDPVFAGYPIITGVDNGSDGIWTTVPSFNTYPFYVSASAPGPGVPIQGTTFVFEIDFPHTIYGVRIIGDGGGVAGSDGTGFVGAQEIRVFTGDSTGRARPVSPPQDADGIIVESAELVWAPAQRGGVIDPNVIGHYVYLGTDPNGVRVSGSAALPVQTVSFSPVLAKDTVYYWRVDELCDDGTVITGYTGSFRTELSLPLIHVQPADAVATAGGNAVFMVTATDPLGGLLEYQWYYDADGFAGGEVPIADGAHYGGAATSQLTIFAIDASDEGYYFCVVNNGSAVATRMARFTERRLIAYWPMNGDPNDIVDGYGGTASGGPVYESGIFGQAIRFDGIDDFVALPGGFADFSAGLTITLWARPTVVSKWARFVELANGRLSDNILFSRGDRTNDLVMEVYNGAAGGAVWGRGLLELNVWQMLTGTVDPQGNVVLYKNGIQAAAGVTNKPNILTRSSCFVGKSNWDGPNEDDLYTGFMDDIRLYNYPLTPQEVADLYVLAPHVEYACVQPPQLDLTGDCKVDLMDLAVLAEAWMECGRYPTCITEVQ
ncbi:MAG: hypothetical protein IH624_12520 [Phycisphaerae bacterium]|nr:hypothetical protein [Phycisphaerae bacterium]